MIGTATGLALFSVAGVLIIYSKLPRGIRKFLEGHSLMTDFIALIAIYLVLGGTLTALFAASIAGLMVSVALYVVNNKEKFSFLDNMFASLKELADSSVKFLNDTFGEEAAA